MGNCVGIGCGLWPVFAGGEGRGRNPMQSLWDGRKLWDEKVDNCQTTY